MIAIFKIFGGWFYGPGYGLLDICFMGTPKNVFSAVIQWRALLMLIMSCWLMVVLNSLSLLIFYLVDHIVFSFAFTSLYFY